MIKKIKNFIVTSFAALLLVPSLGLVSGVGVGLASAACSPGIQSSLGEGADSAAGTGSGTTCTSTSGDASTGLKGLATTITKWFSIIVGATSVLMIIYGGFRYITSGGDSGKVGNAKNTLIYALVGLIIVALAQLIVRVVITQANTSGSSF